MEYSQYNEVSQDLVRRRPSENQSIFKYISLNNAKSWEHFGRTLNQLQLSGSSCSALNDPFEFSPVTLDDVTARVRNGDRTSFGDLVSLSPSPDDIIDPAKRAEFSKSFTAQAKISDDEYVQQKLQDATKFLSYMKRNYRVICFSDRWNSPLQWAHYANDYYGACLHFSAGALSKNGKNLFGYVNYSAQRPIYPLSMAARLVEKRGKSSIYHKSAENEKILFFTKSIDWSYENEIRLVYNAAKVESIEFSPHHILSIILGPRLKHSDLEKIVEIVKTSKVPNIPIHRSELSLNSYSVDIDWSKRV